VRSQDHTTEHFLVEWYDPAFTAAPLPQTAAGLEAAAAAVSAHGTTVHLDLTLAAPADDVLYSVFTADCAETVLEACRHAGHPPDRITTGIQTHLSGPSKTAVSLAGSPNMLPRNDSHA
jgi:hypothetical protein